MERKHIKESRDKYIKIYKTVGEFLADLKKEFGRGKKETVKVAELRRL